MKKTWLMVSICFLWLACIDSAAAQTFKINHQNSAQPEKPGKQKPKAKPGKGAVRPGTRKTATGIGWGNSIEVGRMARAAQDALKRGNVSAAANYAKRAANAAPQNTGLWFLYGYTARLAGRTGESVSAYRRGLQNQPGNAEGLAGLAQTYARMGKVDEAKQLMQQALRSGKMRANDLLVAGELYVRTGDYQQGLGYLQRAEKQKPSSHGELLMATAFMKLKQPQKAKQLLDIARRRDPKNADIFRAVANFYRENDQYAEAIATLKSAPVKKPELLADLAYTYGLAGDKKLSAATYQQAANAQPEKIDFQLGAAGAYLRLGDTEQTRRFLDRAAHLDADHYRVHALRAALLKDEGRTDDAIREYLLALQKTPEAPAEGPLYPIQLRLNLSELYRSSGNLEQAQQQLAQAERSIQGLSLTGPQRAEFLRVRASLRMSGNDLKAADADLQEAMKLDPTNLNVRLQYANLLWREKRVPEARNSFLAVLKQDPRNRFALEGLGYLARDQKDTATAERYFTTLAKYYPDDPVPYLALGDMYTQFRKFDLAEANYQKAFKLAPKNAVIVANGANAAIEAKNYDLARQWVDRATGAMVDDPRVMRERERYLFHSGNYLESAKLGYRVLEKLPKDRNGSVYLAYALYNLGRYDDVLEVASRYETILPKEPNFPLLQGHVHKLSQLLNQAVDDYGRAIERDPKMVDAYVNRGYVLNDLQNAERAMVDFQKALEIRPKNGVAHLGLAFSNLQLHHPSQALDQVALAENAMGENGPTNLVRATAYRQERVFDKAEAHYRKALEFSPNDLALHMALADTLYQARKYSPAIDALNAALRLSPDDPNIYADLAAANAQLGRRDETMRYVQFAEQHGGEFSSVLLATGEALMTLGDEDAAMDRFARALQAPDANRVDARLLIARLFAKQRKFEDAKQQVALAFAESRIGEATPVSSDDYIQAGNIFLEVHDFDLARRFFQRAQQAGAADQAVAIGLANTYLALGDEKNAEKQLALLGSPADYVNNYDYMLARASIYRQRQDPLNALMAYGRAGALGSQNDRVERQEQEVASQVGWGLGHNITMSNDLTVQGLFENETIYITDARLFGTPTALPPPRSSLEWRGSSIYRFHLGGWPTLYSGVNFRQARGRVSLPSENLIIDRHTNDLGFNGGIAPVLRLGTFRVNLNGGLQYTFRRDSISPFAINQNLFRQYLYLDTSSIFNWISLRASGYHESGPFSRRSLSSSDVGGTVEFAVGRPWGTTKLVTGWSGRDLQFEPLIREFFGTSTYAGVEHRFGDSLSMTVLGEYLRSWRVQDLQYVTGQAMAPAFRFSYQPNATWAFDGNFRYERGQGFHAYDNVQSAFLISYTKPFRSDLKDGFGEVPVDFPLRISVGIQQEQFLEFAGSGQSLWRPIVRLSIF